MEKSENRKLIKKYIDTQGNTVELFNTREITITTPGGERSLHISGNADVTIQNAEGQYLQADLLFNRDKFIEELEAWKLGIFRYADAMKQALVLDLYEEKEILFEDKGIDLQLFAQESEEGTGFEELEGQTNLFEEEKPREYRTRKKAGVSDQRLTRLYIPTLPGYEGSIEFQTEAAKRKFPSVAHLQLLRNVENLTVENGNIFFKGSGAVLGDAELRNYVTKERITDIDLSFLQVFYSIYYKDFQDSGFTVLKDVTDIYVPDLAEAMGYGRNIGDSTVDSIKARMGKFEGLMGFIYERGKDKRPSMYSVLHLDKYDGKNNIISFSSQYFKGLLEKEYKASIITDKSGNVKYISDTSQPQRRAIHSTAILSAITKEKNKAAIQIVYEIIRVIEQAGTGLFGESTGNISLKELLNRVPQALEGFKRQKTNKGRYIQRLFVPAFDYLNRYADMEYLNNKYKFLKLPQKKDAEGYGLADLEIVLRFVDNAALDAWKKANPDIVRNLERAAKKKKEAAQKKKKG